MELLAIAEGMEHFKQYIARASFLEVWTDSKIAKDAIMTAQTCSTRWCLRFASRVQQVLTEYYVRCIATDKNPADFWSRDFALETEPTGLVKNPKLSIIDADKKK